MFTIGIYCSGLAAIYTCRAGLDIYYRRHGAIYTCRAGLDIYYCRHGVVYRQGRTRYLLL